MSKLLSRWFPGISKPTRSVKKKTAAFNVLQLECRDVPAGFAGIGTGLVAGYYADTSLTSLAATRIDAGVNFDWGTSAPAAAVPADGFSARWTGKVQAQFSETYTFSVAADEGTRLWVNGRLLVDNWSATTASERSGTIGLTAGETYDLRLEYLDRTGTANVRLSWASASTPKQAVPASQLYASGGWLNADLGTPAAAGSLSAAGGTFTVKGAGSLGGTADQGQFAYQALSGDTGYVVARVASNTGGSAGVMMRDGTAANGLSVAITLNGSNATFTARTAAGATASQTTVAANGATWVKLVRNGTLISGYVSPTGADGTWQHVGTATVKAAGQTLNAGLIAASGTSSLNTASFTNVAVTATVPVGANTDAVNDWSLQNAFVDIFKQNRGFTKPNSTSTAANVGADGWPTEDFQTIVQSGFLNTARIYNGVYKLSFTGRADVNAAWSPATVGNVVYNAATNTTTADVTLNASDSDGGWYFVLQFRNTNGSVKNVKLIRPGYDPNTTQLFTNQFLATVKDFSTIRAMDLLHANNNPTSTWADRTTPTSTTQAGAKGIAWEYVIELANVTGKDIWINIPFGATDDYVRNVAQLFKARLRPDLAVYVEWSNEVWNGQFSQTINNLNAAVAEVQAGMASGTPSNLFYPGETNKNADGTWASQWDWAFRRIARRITEISDIWSSVWGTAAINAQVRPVLASQVAVPYVLKTQLEFIDKVYGDPSAKLYAVAGAPYFFIGSADQQTNLTADDVLNALRAGIAAANAPLAEYSHLATYYGLKHTAYEGGPDTFGGNNIAAKKAASLDPRMKDVIADFLADWYKQGGGLFNWFVAGPTNYDTPYGTWGLTNDITNLNTPKYQGVEQIADGPVISPVVGVPVSGEVLAKDYVAGANPTTDPYPRYLNNGDYRDYMVRVPQAGTYTLTIRYAQVDPGGQLQVIVNDQVIQTLNMPVTGPGYDALWSPNTFADAAPLTIQLKEGLNVVRLRVVTKGYTLYSLKFNGVGSATVPPTGPPTVPPTTPPTVPPPSNTAPVVTAVTASATTVTDKTVGLTATATDDAGESGLIYSWSVVSAPAGGSVTFSPTGTNVAKYSTATFTKAGSYTLRVTATDASGLTATRDVTVSVAQTLTTLGVSPGSMTLTTGATQAFTATAFDQFGQTMATQPAVTWTTTGGGSITTAGVYTAPTTATSATVTATAGGKTATASVAVTAPSTGGQTSVNYQYGFTGATLARNGSAALTAGRLRLANTLTQAGSAYTTQTVSATAGLSTRFQFQIGTLDGSPWSIGDGLTFALQRAGTTALGANGGGLGFTGIASGVAVRFDAVANTLGLSAAGSTQTVDLWAVGIDLRSGHVFQADVGYDGTALTVTLKNTTTGATTTQRFALDLATALGGTTAYAGFTGGTGVLAGNLDVLNWTLTTGGTGTTPVNTAPTVTASAATTTVTGKSVGLTATGTDDAGEAGLKYAWSVVTAPSGGSATFSASGTNAAKSTTATFTKAGSYTLRVTATDAGGLTATKDVTVTVTQTLTGLTVTPGSVSLTTGKTQAFTAAATDQFGQTMATPTVTWGVTGGGTISAAGVYTAPASATTATVTATAGGKTATAKVTVIAAVSTSLTSLTRNGSATLSGSTLRLTNGTNQAGSAFTSTAVSVAKFNTSFQFKLGSLDGSPWSIGDGLTFTLQRSGASALGSLGSGLGVDGIVSAISVRFDVLTNSIRVTGLGTTGVIDLYGPGLDLRSGNAFKADVSYDGTRLTVTLTDTVTGKTATGSFTANLVAALGGTTAYAGFTAGTGVLAGNLDVLSWTYTSL